MFTWVETHKELTNYIKGKENSQAELIELLKSIGITPFNDKGGHDDHDIELEEIDPFTFFCYIYKYGPERRLSYLQKIADKLKIAIPKGESGIPSAQAQKVWLFPYKYKRTNNEVGRLWAFFHKAISNQITDADFKDVLKIHSTGATKLTEGLFYINPEKYLPINGPTKPYIKEVLKLDPNFKTYTEYLTLLDDIKSKSELPFYELSYEAWKWNDQKQKSNYWIFQGNPKVFDFEIALHENLVDDWTVSAHKDKIKSGDKVIIWITGKAAGCYALAEVTSEPHEKTSSEDDHLWKTEDPSELKVDIKITHNLVDNPVLMSQIENIPKLNNIKVGNQGTNFSATEKEFKILLDMAENSMNKKYWLFAPGENATKWDEFYKEGIMGLGWEKLGDLKQYKTKNEIVKRLQELENTTGSKKNDATANYDFYKNIAVGDVVIAKKGRGEYLGYGVVQSDYFYDDKRKTYKKVRKVDWKKKGVWEETGKDIVLKTLTDITKYSDYVERLKELIGIENDTMIKEVKNPLNQILYGPPGTGKTYNTINKALEIINDDEVKALDWSDRTKVKELFDKKMKEEQIVFTTFHQSMSYEEFIEGIKPIEPKEDETDLTYKVESGLFKKMSIEASFNIARSRMSKEITETLDFSNFYDLFIEDIQEKIINNKDVKLKTKSGGTVLIDSISQQGNIIIKHHNGTRTYTVSKPRLTKLQSAIKSLDNVNNINDEFREVIGGSNSSAYWSVLNAIKQATKKVKLKTDEKNYAYEDKIEVVKKMNKDDFNNFQRKNYILIIDEINRGNISQIFGELITLIEEDKRLGKDESLKVTLPYSKEKFGVPPNLYLIGTMNTADRSVEALDTALRRRFSFVEMLPDSTLLGDTEVDGIRLAELLTTINDRIEVLIDRDHTIGHSYFMNVKDMDGLRFTFKNKIIPLLQEYFYGDYQKMEMVIGSLFFNSEKKNKKVEFAVKNYELDEPRKRYEISNVLDESFDMKQAIESLLNPSKSISTTV